MTAKACPRCGYVGEPTSDGFCPHCLPGAGIEMLDAEALRDEARKTRWQGFIYTAMCLDSYADRPDRLGGKER